MTVQLHTPQSDLHLQGHKIRVIIIIMTVSDSWGLFTQNIFPGKISFKNSTQGGETVSFENNTFITLDCLSLSDRNKIVVVFQKFKFEKSSAKIKILKFWKLIIPHYGHLKKAII